MSRPCSDFAPLQFGHLALAAVILRSTIPAFSFMCVFNTSVIIFAASAALLRDQPSLPPRGEKHRDAYPQHQDEAQEHAPEQHQREQRRTAHRESDVIGDEEPAGPAIDVVPRRAGVDHVSAQIASRMMSANGNKQRPRGPALGVMDMIGCTPWFGYHFGHSITVHVEFIANP